MKNKLRAMVAESGKEVLLDTSELTKKLSVTGRKKILKQQLILVTAELRNNDIEVLCGADPVKKSNIIRRCITQTGLGAEPVMEVFSILLYALNCNEYIEKSEWYCGTTANLDSKNTMKIYSYNDVFRALEHAQKLESNNEPTKAMDIYQSLASAGVAQAKTKIALKYLENKDISKDAKERAIKQLKEAANDGHEPASQYLGDCYMKMSRFEEAAKWYGSSVGVGFNKDTLKKIRFLEYVKRECFKTVKLSVLAALLSIVSLVMGLMFCEAGTVAHVGAVVLEALSLASACTVILLNQTNTHTDESFFCTLQTVLWALSMIVLM